MKRFSTLNEVASVTSDVNPGNKLEQTGISNHYTPVNNILTNIKNLFCLPLSIVAANAEDGVSIKLHSTKFVNKESVERVLSEPLYNGVCLKDYIMQQGLDKMTCVDQGQYLVVWFSPSDLKTAAPGLESQPCKENLEDLEIVTIFENDEDEELEDVTKTQIKALITKEDKVKAAKQFGTLVSQQIELPSEYYFAGVKDQSGDESIALRWKYIKRRRHKKSIESVRSLINIYGLGKDAVWVQDFDENSLFKLPDEVTKLIKNILELIDAKETKDPCQYSIEEENKEDKKDKKDKEKKEEKKEEKVDTSSKSDNSNEDVEDDKSRDEDEGGLL